MINHTSLPNRHQSIPATAARALRKPNERLTEQPTCFVMALGSGELTLTIQSFDTAYRRRRRPVSTWFDWAMRRRNTSFVRARFAFLAALGDFVVVVASVVGAGTAYHIGWLRVFGMVPTLLESGILLAALFVLMNALRSEYEVVKYLAFAGHARRVLFVWNMTFLTALVLVFALKETEAVSRATTVLTYLSGFVAIVVLRGMITTYTKRRAGRGHLCVLRVVLVGSEADLRAFTATHRPWTVGVDVIASAVLRGPDTLTEDLALAAASSRVLRPDDIFILAPWTNNEVVEAALAAFMNVPAAIHLGPQPVLDRFTKAAVHRIGSIASLHLVRQPLSLTQTTMKRVFDVVVAAALLMLFVPVFVAVAVAIKLDSSGPVVFVQRRYGFNQQTFRILKFRSMDVAEDDRMLRSATRRDARVTRVGRILRRLSLDELPQLLNVLRGEMSLVGPRPHALAHNQQYERTIADYARRHNVKPGITGWAQIHGLRGEVVSEDTMRSRVEHDLYYIDNWTLGLDLRILGHTVLSPKVFANAY